MRVVEREVRIVVAAVETAREKVRREGMWVSTTFGCLKSDEGPIFRMPSFGSYLLRVVSPSSKSFGQGGTLAYCIRLKAILSTGEFASVTANWFVPVHINAQP